MNRLATTCLTAVLALSITACAPNANEETPNREVTQADGTGIPTSANVKSKQKPEAESEMNDGSSLFAGSEWVENETTSGVPVPSFSVPAKTVEVEGNDVSSGVSGRWVGVPDSEILAYIQAVKDAGFVNDAMETRHETSYDYSANDKESTDDRDYKLIQINLYSVMSTSGEMSESTLTIRVGHIAMDS